MGDVVRGLPGRTAAFESTDNDVKQASIELNINGKPTKIVMVGVHVFTDEALQTIGNLIVQCIMQTVPAVVNQIVTAKFTEAGLVSDLPHATKDKDGVPEGMAKA